ncbi:phosphoglycerate mutase [Paenibacillus sp. L3-i20]|nr:phosphoglycerate mutase [Paenibacillus sp. L3-i20]
MTTIYMVRHAESPYNEGTERTRGLTIEGKKKALEITGLLENEGVNVIVSSPYTRAILTIEELAQKLKLNIDIYEDLREKRFAGDDYSIRDEEFMPFLKQSFLDFSYFLPGGESNAACQNRAVAVLKAIMELYKGKKIAIGTHGNVMTLMMNYFDASYGYDFLTQTKKPDIYKLEFEDLKLIKVTRLSM